MKVELLHLGAANKRHSFLRVSRRFESIVNLAREKPDNMTHVGQEGTMSGNNSQ
jgi:hypothetical protein